MADFRGDARPSTWLTRIVINQALGRLRVRCRDNVVALLDDRPPGGTEPREQAMDEDPDASPETGAMRAELRRVRPGDVVVWVNKDPFPHTVTAAGAFDSGSIGAGKSWRFTGRKVGAHPSVCTLHATMKGTLRVE